MLDQIGFKKRVLRILLSSACPHTVTQQSLQGMWHASVATASAKHWPRSQVLQLDSTAVYTQWPLQWHASSLTLYSLNTTTRLLDKFVRQVKTRVPLDIHWTLGVHYSWLTDCPTHRHTVVHSLSHTTLSHYTSLLVDHCPCFPRYHP